jgi:hypothetical protein
MCVTHVAETVVERTIVDHVLLKLWLDAYTYLCLVAHHITLFALLCIIFCCFHRYVKWIELVEAEFFAQGDREKAINVAVSPFCDRVTASRWNSQAGFINFVVTPLLQLWGKFLPGAEGRCRRLHDNACVVRSYIAAATAATDASASADSAALAAAAVGSKITTARVDNTLDDENTSTRTGTSTSTSTTCATTTKVTKSSRDADDTGSEAVRRTSSCNHGNRRGSLRVPA